jgi:hypothetical protein
VQSACDRDRLLRLTEEDDDADSGRDVVARDSRRGETIGHS